MRLSDIKGDRTLDVVADCIGPISNLANDKSVKAIFKKEGLRDAKDPRKVIVARTTKMLPQVIKRNKADIIKVLSAIAGMTPEEYAEGMSLASLITDVIDLLNDEAFLSFFESASLTEE